MLDEKKIEKLVKWKIAIDPNYPWFERDFVEPCMEALGDDEDEIIEFLETTSQDILDGIYSFTEVLYAKFPTDKMGKAIDEIFGN